jgi:hypothetical protein
MSIPPLRPQPPAWNSATVRDTVGEDRLSDPDDGSLSRGDQETASSSGLPAAPDVAGGKEAEPLGILRRTGRSLAPLFPQAPRTPRSRSAAIWTGLANLAAIVLSAWIMLARQTGLPAWRTIWAEDRTIFLPQALYHPLGSLFQPYDGYLEFYPRLIAELVARFPLKDAAAGFAVAGALTAACTAVFVFHASSGHVRRPELRVLLAASVLLLPTALVEIANSGVNSTWYLLFGTFWALLWRPRSRWGMAVAALVCFASSSSNALAALYVPLVAARVIVLPRAREHAATLGWVAGGVLQLPAVLTLSRNHQATTLTKALAFYGHNVILAAVAGHHGTELLRSAGWLGSGTEVATLVVAAVAAWACIRLGPRVRVFVVTALALGLILTLVATLVHGQVASILSARPALYLRGSRYAQTPILMIDSAAIVAVDAVLRRHRIRFERAAQVMAAFLLVAVLGTMWTSDFRYANSRATFEPWSHIVAKIEGRCQPHSPGKRRVTRAEGIPCSAVHK